MCDEKNCTWRGGISAVEHATRAFYKTNKYIDIEID